MSLGVWVTSFRMSFSSSINFLCLFEQSNIILLLKESRKWNFLLKKCLATKLWSSPFVEDAFSSPVCNFGFLVKTQVAYRNVDFCVFLSTSKFNFFLLQGMWSPATNKSTKAKNHYQTFQTSIKSNLCLFYNWSLRQRENKILFYLMLFYMGTMKTPISLINEYIFILWPCCF